MFSKRADPNLNLNTIPIFKDKKVGTDIFSCLMFACQELDPELIMILLQFNANIFIKDQHGRSALHYAIQSYEKTERKDMALNIINHLLSRNQNNSSLLNEHEIDTGSTLLSYAVSKNLLPIVSILLENGADPDIQNINDGNTPLHLAVMGNKREIINLLLSAGAGLTIRNKHDQTAIDISSLSNQTELYLQLVDEYNKRGQQQFNCKKPTLPSHAPVINKLNNELNNFIPTEGDVEENRSSTSSNNQIFQTNNIKQQNQRNVNFFQNNTSLGNTQNINININSNAMNNSNLKYKSAKLQKLNYLMERRNNAEIPGRSIKDKVFKFPMGQNPVNYTTNIEIPFNFLNPPENKLDKSQKSMSSKNQLHTFISN
jgi:ankyrin repeat protein